MTHLPVRTRARRSIAGVVFVCATGCSSAISPQVIEDAQIAVRVKTALVNDPELGTRAIEVRVTGGVVRLSGRVRFETEAQRAVQLAQSVAGVKRVDSELQVADPPPPAADRTRRRAGREPPWPEPPDDPRLLAVGGSIGWRDARAWTFDSAIHVGPLVRFGAGSGLKLTFGFGWFQTDVSSDTAREETLARMSIRPVLGGVGYTVGNDRVSATASFVGGVAFNSLRPREDVAGRTLALAVDNSLAGRTGLSIWYDTSHRIAFNVFVGYLLTRPRVVFLEDGRAGARVLRADATLVTFGVAYKLF